jgi:hypothetical protein
MSDISQQSSDSDSDSELETHRKPILNFSLKPSRLNTMTTVTLSEIKNLCEIIPQYDGNVKILNNYLSAVDDVYLTLSNINITQIQKTYLFGLIKSKLTQKAAELLAENKCENWEDLKLYLKTNFTDKSTAETILLDILYCKYKVNSETTLKYISEKFAHYKSKILLTNYAQIQKNAILAEIQKTVVAHFISLTPVTIRGSFVVKNPETLEQCEILLKNEFNFSNRNQLSINKEQNFSSNLPQKKFPAQQFPSKPIQFQPRQEQPKPFAPRQNIKNYQETKRAFTPKPMTQQTRVTTPMSVQTIRQNYNIESEEQFNEEENIDDTEIDQNTDSFLDIETSTLESIT